jgi:hypothetical protein
MRRNRDKRTAYRPPPLPPLPLNIGMPEIGDVPKEPKDGWIWRTYCRVFRIRYD